MQHIIDKLSPFFKCIFICSKPWDSWNCDQMSINDFCLIESENKFFIDLINSLLELSELQLEDVEFLFSCFTDLYLNYSLYHKGSFKKNEFEEYWTDTFDYDSFLKVAKPLIFKLKINHKVSSF